MWLVGVVGVFVLFPLIKLAKKLKEQDIQFFLDYPYRFH